VKRLHTLAPDRAGASEQWNLTVEPCSRPSSGPFVLNDGYQLRSIASIMFGMEIDALILCQHLNSVNTHLLWLVVKPVPLGEVINSGDTTEANHYPNILRQLTNSVGGKLMQLHLKF
jgi:hypothetical protein